MPLPFDHPIAKGFQLLQVSWAEGSEWCLLGRGGEVFHLHAAPDACQDCWVLLSNVLGHCLRIRNWT